MKILMSAYACEPDRGSEPGIGWHWSLELARLGHEVWVLTRSNNRDSISRSLPGLTNLHFVYYDLPPWLATLKRRAPILQAYYALWQRGAYRLASALHRAERFDVVQHITFGILRQATFMGRLGTHFVLGPLGGGERVPLRLRMDYGLRGHSVDMLRDLSNAAVSVNPWSNEAFGAATLILARTAATRAAIPARYRHKVSIVTGIGVQHSSDASACRGDGPFRVLFAGRFLFWKGMQYGLRAFQRLLRVVPHARLTLVGTGPEEGRWRQLCERLELSHAVDWRRWVAHGRMDETYASHDVLLFPSLHDSGGLVILEAMAHGLPVICFDLGGPGSLVDSTCGIVVSPGDSTEAMVSGLAEGLVALASDRGALDRLRTGARRRADQCSWAATVRSVYGPGGLLERAIGDHPR